MIETKTLILKLQDSKNCKSQIHAGFIEPNLKCWSGVFDREDTTWYNQVQEEWLTIFMIIFNCHLCTVLRFDLSVALIFKPVTKLLLYGWIIPFGWGGVVVSWFACKQARVGRSTSVGKIEQRKTRKWARSDLCNFFYISTLETTEKNESINFQERYELGSSDFSGKV